MNKLFICALITLALSGCYTTHTAQTIKPLNDYQLCIEARVTVNTELAKDEIISRGIMSQSEFDLAKSGKIQTGMSECGLIISQGIPNDGWIMCGRINVSQGGYGTHKQYVYDPCSDFKETYYIYVKNGRISSWQY